MSSSFSKSDFFYDWRSKGRVKWISKPSHFLRLCLDVKQCYIKKRRLTDSETGKTSFTGVFSNPDTFTRPKLQDTTRLPIVGTLIFDLSLCIATWNRVLLSKTRKVSDIWPELVVSGNLTEPGMDTDRLFVCWSSVEETEMVEFSRELFCLVCMAKEEPLKVSGLKYMTLAMRFGVAKRNDWLELDGRSWGNMSSVLISLKKSEKVTIDGARGRGEGGGAVL